MAAPVVPSVRIIKSTAYKGGTRQWSNRYSFDGATPVDGTHWAALVTAITNVEKTCLPSYTTIVGAVGYAAGSEVPVYSGTLSIAGTLTPGGSDFGTPLEVAALIRWSTAARSTKNHPIYCFSYIHSALILGSTPAKDTLSSAQKTALTTFAGDWVTGFSDGTVTRHRATPSGHVVTGSLVEEYVTHRDFPYSTSV